MCCACMLGNCQCCTRITIRNDGLRASRKGRRLFQHGNAHDVLIRVIPNLTQEGAGRRLG